jgi:predicted nucleic acid-binding protein
VLVTLDASVICKWFLPREREPDWPHALKLAQKLSSGDLTVLQPIHWVAEVLSVLVRWTPDEHSLQVERVLGLRLSVFDRPAVYRLANRMAAQHGAHLFDTLYHAVAIQTSAMLITADDRYHRAAHADGQIALLKDWQMGG